MVVNYLTNLTEKQDLYKALHVDNSSKNPIFNMGSNSVFEAYKSDGLTSYASYIEELLKMNHPVMIAAGEFDMQDGAQTQIAWMKKIFKDVLPQEFFEMDRPVYYYYAPNNTQIQVGGYYRHGGNFTFVTTPKSGHFMPHDNYDCAKSYLDDFIANNSLNYCHNPQGCRVN